MCPFKEVFKDPSGGKDLNINLKKSFNEYGLEFGKGPFGIIKRVSIYQRSGEVAIKRYKIENANNEIFMFKELEVGELMNDSEFSGKIYGCVYEAESNFKFFLKLFKGYAPMFVYTLNEKLFKFIPNRLSSYDKRQPPSERLKIYVQIFKGLKDLWDRGFVHNDIRPENILTNAESTKMYLTGYNLASKIDEPIQSVGNPFFRPPIKANSRFPQQKDDMYSAALTILSWESQEGNGISVQEIGADDSFDLVLATYYKPTQTALIERAKQEIQQEFGSFQKDSISENKINFTTLLFMMIEYHSNIYTYDKVIQIIERIIIELRNQPILQTTRNLINSSKDPPKQKLISSTTDNTKIENSNNEIHNSESHQSQMSTENKEFEKSKQKIKKTRFESNLQNSQNEKQLESIIPGDKTSTISDQSTHHISKSFDLVYNKI